MIVFLYVTCHHGYKSPSLLFPDDSPLMMLPSTGPGGRKCRGESEGGKAGAGVSVSGEPTVGESVRENEFVIPKMGRVW